MNFGESIQLHIKNRIFKITTIGYINKFYKIFPFEIYLFFVIIFPRRVDFLSDFVLYVHKESREYFIKYRVVMQGYTIVYRCYNHYCKEENIKVRREYFQQN